MTDHEVLEAASRRVCHAWTSGRWAANCWGSTVSSTDPRAVTWCAVGAILSLSPERAQRRRLLRQLDGIVMAARKPQGWMHRLFTRVFPGSALMYLNDRYGRDAVMEVFAEAVQHPVPISKPARRPSRLWAQLGP